MHFTDQDISLSLTRSEQAKLRDEQLVSAARAGEPDAFAALQSHYSRRVYSTILAITKNHEDAEDALQDTFLRAYLALRNFQGRSSFYSWLTRIAMNSALMILRKRRSHPEVSFDPVYESGDDFPPFEVQDSALNPEQIYDQRQRCVHMLSAIQKLTPNLRGPIRTRMAHGSSLKKIARDFGISEAAVKSRLGRARAQLSAG